MWGYTSGLLSGGLLGVISPSKLLEGAAEMPLMAWSRQSDITADRAGLLAVGDEALARRVLLAWSIRSARLLKEVNIEEWMKQEESQRRSHDAALGDGDFVLDVHDATVAAAGTGGEGAGR